VRIPKRFVVALIITCSLLAARMLAQGSAGIAALYPSDVGIESDPSVIFVEKFEETSLATMLGRWTAVAPGTMSFSADVAAGSPSGSRSINVPAVQGQDSGGQLYYTFPGVDVLYVRYYTKYASTGIPHHSGIWVGGYNPQSAWPDPQAGSKPVGDERFIAGAEQNTVGRFEHYNYWMNMRPDGWGSYWGNFLLNNPSVTIAPDQWACVEEMVKLNNPTTAFNGEHALWLNGVKVSHLGQGFPNGSWSGGIFTQAQSGTPFEGFRWRSDANLKINWIWLQNYSDNLSTSVKFDHVVAATTYIGCLSSGGTLPLQPANLRIITSQ
jgi:hypothetical protein